MGLSFSGEQHLPHPRVTVWRLLNEPHILKACVPGCEVLVRSNDNEFQATVCSKVGPIKARFSGRVELTDIDYLNGYRIIGEGAGGLAGFAKVAATIALTDQQQGTLLTYLADAQIGGKLAQLGQRLLAGTAKRLIEEFFSNFVRVVSADAAGQAECGKIGCDLNA